MSQPLSRHQGNRTCAGSNVQKSAVARKDGHKGTEQYAVGIDLHGAALIDDAELLETEYVCRFLHSLRSVEMTIEHSVEMTPTSFTRVDKTPRPRTKNDLHVNQLDNPKTN